MYLEEHFSRRFLISIAVIGAHNFFIVAIGLIVFHFEPGQSELWARERYLLSLQRGLNNLRTKAQLACSVSREADFLEASIILDYAYGKLEDLVSKGYKADFKQKMGSSYSKRSASIPSNEKNRGFVLKPTIEDEEKVQGGQAVAFDEHEDDECYRESKAEFLGNAWVWRKKRPHYCAQLKYILELRKILLLEYARMPETSARLSSGSPALSSKTAEDLLYALEVIHHDIGILYAFENGGVTRNSNECRWQENKNAYVGFRNCQAVIEVLPEMRPALRAEAAWMHDF